MWRTAAVAVPIIERTLIAASNTPARGPETMGAVSHSHSHSHVPPSASGTRLRIALGLILGLMLGEVVVGVLAGSLALLSDAAHMLTDAGALALALLALRLARRPPGG